MSDLILTYDELSELLKRSPDATRQLVRRRRWRRTIGNDTKTRVVVPSEELEEIRPPDVSTTTREHKVPTLPGHTPDLHLDEPMEPFDGVQALVGAFEGRIFDLQSRVADLALELQEVRSKAARADALEAILEIERSHAVTLKNEHDRLLCERDMLLERVLNPVRLGFFGRLKRKVGG